MYYGKEYWWSLMSFWPDGVKEGLGQPGYFKRKILSTDQTGFMKLIYIMLIIIYMDL